VISHERAFEAHKIAFSCESACRVLRSARRVRENADKGPASAVVTLEGLQKPCLYSL
jgi:hypothetical protein